MGIQFEKNFYTNEMNEHLINFDHLQFKYEKVGYRTFSKRYDDDLSNMFATDKENDITKIVTNLSVALWSGVVKTIYHLAIAIFKGIPKAIEGDENYLKAHVFFIGRDLQESFGNVTSIFDEKHGLYHIQESNFQKTCYDYFLSKSKPSHVSSGEEKPRKEKKDKDKASELTYNPGNTFGNTSVGSSFKNRPLEDAESVATKYDSISSNASKTSAEEAQDAIDEIKKKSCSSDAQGRLLLDLAVNYRKKGDLENAYAVIKDFSVKSDDRGKFLEGLAEDYYNKGDREKAIDMIDKYGVDSDVKGKFFERLAEDYYTKGDLKKAFEMIDKYGVDSDVKGKFFERLAEDYYTKGDREKAFKMIDKYDVDPDVKGKFLEGLAEDYYTKGDLKKAFEMIDNFSVDSKVKGKFFERLAEDYYREGDLKKAFEMIDNYDVDPDVKGKFFEKLAEKLYQDENWKDLQEVAFKCDEAIKDKYSAILIEHFYQNNNTKKLKEIIKKFMKDALYDVLSFDERHLFFADTKNTSKKFENFRNYISCIVEDKYNEFTQKLTSCKRDEFIKHIKRIAQAAKIKNDFLVLIR